MRFEVLYPNGEPHEVELQGTLAVLGRDPASDLVLNDVKCSRRHAVVEAGADGLAIRDTDSANGIYVNGRKVERARLHEGDVVRLGEVTLKVLPEEITGTVVMGPDDMMEIAPATRPKPASPPPPPSPAIGGFKTEPVPAASPARPSGSPKPEPRAQAAAPPRAPASQPGATRDAPAGARPLTVTVVAGLWIVAALVYLGSAAWLLVARPLPAPWGMVSAVALALLAILGGVIAVGLLMLRPWARVLQIGVAALGLLNCPMTLASATVLLYFLKKETARHFTRAPAEPAPAGDAIPETAFAATVLAMTALGAVATALLAAYARRMGP